MPRWLHHATGRLAARAGDDELGVGADPRRVAEAKEVWKGSPTRPGDGAAHPGALIRMAVGPQGAQGPR